MDLATSVKLLVLTAAVVYILHSNVVIPEQCDVPDSLGPGG